MGDFGLMWNFPRSWELPVLNSEIFTKIQCGAILRTYIERYASDNPVGHKSTVNFCHVVLSTDLLLIYSIKLGQH